MGSSGISHLNLEIVDDRLFSTTVGNDNDDDDDESVCFSEADEGSCYSQFYSTASGSRRESSVVGSDCSIEFENELNIFLETVKRDCRICKMSVEMGGGSNYLENGIGIELGCCCKNDLAAAHQLCAQTWFKIKGNMICEICNSTAQNVVALSYDVESPEHVYVLAPSYYLANVVGRSYDIESPHHVYDFEPITWSANGRVSNTVSPTYDVESQPTTLSANQDSAQASSTLATLPANQDSALTLARLRLGHWLVNFVLACICFVFVAWLSDFRLPR